jgi:hypothetical protein
VRIEGERIAAAALMLDEPEKRVFSLPPPARHHNVIWYMREQGITVEEIARAEQGFVTSAGRFAWRKPAYRIAEIAGQIIKECPGPPRTLFSEHLW